MTPIRPNRPIPPESILRDALTLMAWPGWTLEAAMADKYRSRILVARARSILHRMRATQSAERQAGANQ